jgi:hypothetical protein
MTLVTDDSRLPSLFSHSTRKDWGVGVLAWEANGKRGYLFEDGEERTMASGFHELMRKVEQPSSDQKAASLRLARVLASRASASSNGANGPTLRELLYGKSPYEQRFDRYVATLGAYLGEAVRWEIATGLPALIHPSEHVCVHPTAFRLQIKVTGSRSTAAARPTSAGYTRLLIVTRVVAKKLIENDETARDLLDVHDFIRITLKPPSKARLSSAKAKHSVAPAAVEDSDDAESGADAAEDDQDEE